MPDAEHARDRGTVQASDQAVKNASVFAGVGGFDLGFDAAGMQPTAQVEINKHSRAILARHWPNVERTDDVVSTTGKGTQSTYKLCKLLILYLFQLKSSGY